MSGLQTAHANTPVASIEPRSGVVSIPSAQSNCGPPRVACIASCIALAVSADLSEAQLRRCKWALRRFWVKEEIRMARLTSLGRAASIAPTLNG